MKTIGIEESVAIGKHKNYILKSKTDTGAYNCAIDCSYSKTAVDENGIERLVFVLLHPNHPSYTGKKHSVKNFKKKEIKSSNGTITIRYQVKLKVHLKGKSYKTTFNLSDRSQMRYPVLLGRKFIANRFLIDVSVNRKSKMKKSRRH